MSNKEYKRIYAREWRKKHPGYNSLYSNNRRLSQPWVVHHNSAEQRCNNPRTESYKYYGGRGIKMKLTTEDIKTLWFRDRAYLLKRPSLDRINADGDYNMANCRFIELSLNSSNHRITNRKAVVQKNRSGSTIAVFGSIAEASRQTGVNYRSISACALGKKHYITAGGFRWEHITKKE